MTITHSVSARDWSVQPPYLHPPYTSTVLRSPRCALIPRQTAAADLHGPMFNGALHPLDADLTRNAGTGSEAQGQRIYVTGRLLEDDGRPIAGALIEVWQANAAGRYRHNGDQHPAPLDPHFTGGGRCLTGPDGEYRFVSIRPGAYPWRNHYNAWRPAHIHFSAFGRTFASRLVTQMYFPGDPLLALDPIFNAVPAHGRSLLIAEYAHDVTEPDVALGFRFDIVLRGRRETPVDRR